MSLKVDRFTVYSCLHRLQPHHIRIRHPASLKPMLQTSWASQSIDRSSVQILLFYQENSMTPKCLVCFIVVLGIIPNVINPAPLGFKFFQLNLVSDEHLFQCSCYTAASFTSVKICVKKTSDSYCGHVLADCLCSTLSALVKRGAPNSLNCIYTEPHTDDSTATDGPVDHSGAFDEQWQDELFKSMVTKEPKNREFFINKDMKHPREQAFANVNTRLITMTALRHRGPNRRLAIRSFMNTWRQSSPIALVRSGNSRSRQMNLRLVPRGSLCISSLNWDPS